MCIEFALVDGYLKAVGAGVVIHRSLRGWNALLSPSPIVVEIFCMDSVEVQVSLT